MVVADTAPRNRFGFANKPRTSTLPIPDPIPSRLPTGPRPSTAVLPVPTTRRRSSSVSAVPAENQSKLAGLERELAHATSHSEAQASELASFKTKLTAKDRELLKIENELMSLQKESANAIESIKEKLESRLAQSKDEAEELKRDLVGTKESSNKNLRDAHNSISSLEDRVRVLGLEVTKKETDLMKLEAGRDGLSEELRISIETSISSKKKSILAVEELVSEKQSIERLLDQTKVELKREIGKEKEREKLSNQLESLRLEMEESKASHIKAITAVVSEKEELSKELSTMKSELELSKSTSNPPLIQDDSVLEAKSAELVSVKQELLIAGETIKKLEGLDVVPSEIVNLERIKLEKKITGLEQDIKESSEEISRIDIAKEELVDSLRASSAREATFDSTVMELKKNLATVKQELKIVE